MDTCENGSLSLFEYSSDVLKKKIRVLDVFDTDNKCFILVTTNDKMVTTNYVVYSSTDSTIHIDRSLQFLTTLGFTFNITFDNKAYELSVEVHDNTINDGSTCVDYRNLNYIYGECNYKAPKNYIYSSYGCYPPWMSDEIHDKLCEIDVKSMAIDGKLHEQLWKYFDMLTDGRKIDLMKQCLPACYQIKAKLEKIFDYPYRLNNARLMITEAEENVKVFKAVYSFDIFTLTVELGSALGLWLGKNILFSCEFTFKEL